MSTNRSLFSTAGRWAALGFFVATVSTMHAQQTSSVQPALSSIKTPVFVAYNAAPVDLNSSSSSSAATSDSSDSSTSDSASSSLSAERFNLSAAAFDSTQPPPRRRYGRPNYSDSHTNPDGSSKYAFFAGGGFTVPTGGTANYLKTNYDIQAGGGRNFNKTLGVMIQFDYDDFGIQTATLNKLLAAYNSIGANFSSLSGNSHVLSFSLDPVVNFAQGERTGAYFTGGVGWYHKTANFTTPGTATECSIYYGCFQYTANETVDKYTSNAVGFNGGLGYTYKFSKFANERFYVEARYVYSDNQKRPYSLGSSTNTYFNAFPQNSAMTSYIPITFGLRF